MVIVLIIMGLLLWGYSNCSLSDEIDGQPIRFGWHCQTEESALP